MVNTIKNNPKSKTNFFSSFTKKGKKDPNNVSTKTGGGAKAFLSKLSGAFLLPISVLAIAGLFLGVGATIAGNASGSAGKDFGEFIKQLGDPLFGALPLLFAAAIAVSFTEEAGVAVFNAIIGYVIFSGLQSVFINDVQQLSSWKTDISGQLIYETHKIGENEFVSLKTPIYETVGYNVLFGGALREPEALKSIVGNSLGFKTLQTSVFGGIIIGFVVQWAYMRFHTIQLPQFISFFGGKRFVAFAVIILMIPLVFAFLLLWPYIGYAFNWVGKNSGKIPYGFDSFIFGFIERCLVPFGLHHVFYSPLWYTAAGADVAENLNQWLAKGNTIDSSQLNELAKVLKGTVGNLNINGQTINGIVGASVVGDSTTSLALIGFNGNDIKYTLVGQTTAKSKPLFLFIQDELGLKIGRFLQGKFSFMQWGLPFAGLAMVMAAPKENRKLAIGVVFPASLTCFVTGVTEPIEFTFLFLAPLMFFGFHAFMCATSFMLMNVLQVHIAQAFSGGFLDLMIYGAIPVLKGTNFWWTIVVGAGYAPAYFFVFYFWIKKADLPTPGRGGNTKLFTKKDYQESKESNVENGAIEPQIIKIIEGYGGKENILKTANCASRLRFDVVDANLVSEEKLKEAGAFGVRRTSNSHVQAIFGPLAEQLRIKIDKALASNELNDSAKVSNNSTEQLNDELACEPCSDHVCNDNCGCELSEGAKESLIRDKTKEFLKFVEIIGGYSNIEKIYRRKNQIIIELEQKIQINSDEKFELYNSISVEIHDKQFEFNYETLELAKEVQEHIKLVTKDF